MNPSLYHALWVKLQQVADHTTRYEMEDIIPSREQDEHATYQGHRFILGPFYVVLARRRGR